MGFKVRIYVFFFFFSSPSSPEGLKAMFSLPEITPEVPLAKNGHA